MHAIIMFQDLCIHAMYDCGKYAFVHSQKCPEKLNPEFHAEIGLTGFPK
jgi:hypothetical protein